MAFAAANKAMHVVGMGIVNQHAHGGVRIERVARLPVLRLSFQPRQELVSDALLEQQTGPGDAHLSRL